MVGVMEFEIHFDIGWRCSGDSVMVRWRGHGCEKDE